MIATPNYKLNYQHIAFADVKVGDIAWIDNYQDGSFPHANPLISGSYEVTGITDMWIDLDCLFNYLSGGRRRSTRLWVYGDGAHLLKEKAQ
jgi:hypothetical protein